MRRVLLVFLALLPLMASALDKLVVDARYPREATGTMHYAKRLTFSVGSARPLTFKGELLPIPGPTYRVSSGRYLMLGWSSMGSGMQTMHAYLLRVHDGAVGYVDQFSLTTDRPAAGILVRHQSDGSIMIGVPEPSNGFLHSEEDWALSISSKGNDLQIAQMRDLNYEAVVVRSDDLWYAPPMQIAPHPDRVAWIAITEFDFELAK